MLQITHHDALRFFQQQLMTKANDFAEDAFYPSTVALPRWLRSEDCAHAWNSSSSNAQEGVLPVEE